MTLIVGLGNPGTEYTNTRHNVGFMALDALSSNLRVSFTENTKFKGEITNSTIQDKKVFLLKPNTYMNLSGEAAQAVLHYYKLTTSDTVVIHDDIDLTLGDVRIKRGGGHAGHNGLRSIDGHIGKEYWRIRVGVGRPERGDVSDYVLENFTKSEKVVIEEVIGSLVANIEHIAHLRWDMFKL